MKLFETIGSLIVTKVLRFQKNAELVVVNSDNTETKIDLTELAALDSIVAEDLAKIDGITNGTGAAGKAAVLDSSGDFDNGVGVTSNTGATLSTGAGTGITAGTGTIVESSVTKVGGITKTEILVDLTGLDSDATLGDIIGVDGTANPCHFGQITAARNGSVFAGLVTCLEAPGGGEVDIDLYAADEGTGVTDGAVGDLTETALLAAAADWTINTSKALTAFPGADQYLYLTVGTSSTPTAGTYTGGKFLIELWGN